MSAGVRAGYKRSELGPIPNEWQVKTFNDVSRVIQGLQVAISERLKRPTKNAKIYITIQYLNDKKNIEYIENYSPAVVCEVNDVLMTRTGNTGVVVSGVEGVFHNNFFKIVYQKAFLDGDFLCAFLRLPSTQRVILAKAGASTIPDLNHADFYSIPVPLPPLNEQRAIATALSDVEALLSGLDSLIAKKQNLKQAAMQQLLTGQTRLPGFSGEWEVKRLGDVAEIVMGQSPSSLNYNRSGDGLPLIQGNADIRDRLTIRRIYTTEITKRGREGDVLMSVRAPVGEISRATFDVCLGRGVCAIRFPNDFMFHVLIGLEPTWVRISKGSTFDSVNSSDVRALEIALPSEVEEQISIATVLSDMDTELAALQARRDKTRALKQGMMQELLTGRIRLVSSGG